MVYGRAGGDDRYLGNCEMVMGKNHTIYVATEEIWEKSKAHARILGISHSRLIEDALVRYMDSVSNDDALMIEKLRALLKHQSQRHSQRSLKCRDCRLPVRRDSEGRNIDDVGGQCCPGTQLLHRI